MLILSKLYFFEALEPGNCWACSNPIFRGDPAAQICLEQPHGPIFEGLLCQQCRDRTDEQILSAVIAHQLQRAVHTDTPTHLHRFLRDFISKQDIMIADL